MVVRLSKLDTTYVKPKQTMDEAKNWTGMRPGGPHCPEQKMNRYGNILAYDKTRVVLKRPIDGKKSFKTFWPLFHLFCPLIHGSRTRAGDMTV